MHSLKSIPIIPKKSYLYRGKKFKELDLDKVIQLKPDLVLIDELAHSNVPGAIHKKRYLDIIELLDHGINVYTTINIQHLESLNDEIQHITKIKVRETVPDSILEQANDIVVIDLPINELLERLEQGKVYIKDQANRAVNHFFTPVKLMALRELTLKIAAKNVNHQAIAHQVALGVDDCYLNSNTIMVCLSTNPITPRLIRQAKQLAQTHKSQLIAIYIETPKSIYYSQNKNKRIHHYIRLAEQLGFHTLVIPATNQAKTIIQAAHKFHVNLIVMGKSTRNHWRDKIQGSIVYEVIRHSGKINIHIVNDKSQESYIKPLPKNREKPSINHYLKATLLTTLSGGLSWLFSHYLSPESTAIMLFLLTNIYSAYRWGAKVSLYSSCLGLLIYCIFFIPPYNSLALGSIQGILTFGIFSIISLAAHYITSRLRTEKQSLIKREKYYKTLLIFSEKIITANNIDQFKDLLKKELSYIFNTDNFT
ncbi:DUF4118 domain-containing protein, partial [Piscirickettsia litoralis]|uniref:DUF4118 domain-containing protein n=1 Tax=Piscirickettsia litoralis TaxID=1891921 RepID=UPI0013012C87